MPGLGIAARNDDAVEVVEAAEQAHGVVDRGLGAVRFVKELQDEFDHIVFECLHLQVDGAVRVAAALCGSCLKEFRLVELELVFAAALRLIEGPVGVREEVAVCRAVFGVECDADADGKR